MCLRLHLFSLLPLCPILLVNPLYYLEPMRIMLILSLAHTKKQNAYLLAVTLPLFSYIVSGHPVLPKMLLISYELAFNVFIYVVLSKKLNNAFLAMLSSILITKILYYGIKYIMISLGILDMGLISTPLYIQALTTILFSSYIFMIMMLKKK